MHALSIKMSPVNRQNGRHPFKPEEILVLCNKANELEDFMNYKSVFTKKRHLFEHKCQNRQLGEGGRGVMVGWQRPLNPLLYFFAEPHSMFQSTKKTPDNDNVLKSTSSTQTCFQPNCNIGHLLQSGKEGLSQFYLY